MRIVDVCFTPDEISGGNIDIAVVIDVLRATTVITKALAMGASSIITVVTVEEAWQTKRKKPDFLLAGERKGLKIDGFDFGNSPMEITEERVFNKNIITTTSNGTKAINAVNDSNKVLLASFINLKAVVNYLNAANGNIKIVCSGTDNKPTFEDTICAGGIVNGLSENKITPTNSAKIARETYIENGADIKSSMLNKSSHARYLTSIGYGDDVDFCAKMNLYDIVPLRRNKSFIRSV